MKKLRWQILVVFLALVAIGVLLIGQQPTIALPGLPVAPQVQPAQGGEYSEALVGAFGRLNPVLDVNNQVDHDVDRLLFSGLIAYDDHGVPRGDLAETWGISQDGTTYNFSIRPNAVWHDGAPLTSQDVAFTVDLLRADTLPVPADLRDFWKQVEVKIIDDKLLQFVLPESFAPFLGYLTFGVLPQHLLADLPAESLIDAQFNIKPVGSGPYKFERLLLDNGQIQGLVLKAFDQYYARRPFIDTLVFRYYPDAAAALSAYQKGDVLGISHITTETLPQALQEPRLKIYTARAPQLALVFLNLDNPQLPFFQDVVVRRALLQAANRQLIVDRILNGQAIVADGPVFPGTWAYYDNIEHVAYEPQAALAEIKKAGYTVPAEGGSVRSKDGVRLEFDLVYPDEGPFPAIAQELQKDWQELGMQVNLKAASYDELISKYLEPRAYGAALIDLNMSDSPDPDPYPFWHQTQKTGGQNYSGWDDRQASEFLEQARVNVDFGDRTKLYRNFQVRFTKEMPSLPLFYPVYSYGVDETVQGVRMGPLFNPSDRFETLPSWFLRTGRGAAPAVQTQEASLQVTPTPAQ